MELSQRERASHPGQQQLAIKPRLKPSLSSPSVLRSSTLPSPSSSSSLLSSSSSTFASLSLRSPSLPSISEASPPPPRVQPRRHSRPVPKNLSPSPPLFLPPYHTHPPSCTPCVPSALGLTRRSLTTSVSPLSDLIARFCSAAMASLAPQTGSNRTRGTSHFDFKTATTGVAAKAMRNEIAKLVASVEDPQSRKVRAGCYIWRIPLLTMPCPRRTSTLRCSLSSTYSHATSPTARRASRCTCC
jgi:hypothetical protein